MKVSEATSILSLSQPTVRARVEAGVLVPVRGASPVRVEILSLADVKHALDSSASTRPTGTSSPR